MKPYSRLMKYHAHAGLHEDIDSCGEYNALNKVTQMEHVICQSCFNRRHMEEKAPTVKILKSSYVGA